MKPISTHVRSRLFTGQQNKNIKSIAYHAIVMTSFLMAASAIGYFFRCLGLPETNIAIVYLLAVLLTTSITKEHIWGLLASVIATFAFNYFFTEPYFTFSVNASSYIITFVIMTITALVTSALTLHAKQNELKAQERESVTKALYTMINQLTGATDIHDIASISIRTISDVTCNKAACLCFDENGIPEQTFIQQVSPEEQINRRIADSDEIMDGLEEISAGYKIGTEFYDWPICGREMVLGIIRIPKENAALMNEVHIRLLRSIIESTALAMDRFRSVQQRIKSREEATQEHYRSNLLRAISHDLRTPLSGIMGTTEMLGHMTEKDDPRCGLIEGIYKDAEWLHALVENILSLTRLQDGKLTLHKQLEAVEEVVSGAISHIARRSPAYEIAVNAPEELFLVPMDAKQIEQVLINLMDNAIKHTTPQNEISISVTEDQDKNCAVFLVRDRGEGIAASDLPNIFEMYYSSHSSHSDARIGIGLGLAICDAIINAHGGSIKARNRTDGPGAEFMFTLPLEVNTNE